MCLGENKSSEPERQGSDDGKFVNLDASLSFLMCKVGIMTSCPAGRGVDEMS